MPNLTDDPSTITHAPFAGRSPRGERADRLLPRPNPGPEPPPSPPALIAALTLLLAGLAIAAGAWWSFRRRRVARIEGHRSPPPTPPPMPALSELARDALAARLGPAWAARTTEELAAAPELAEAFGDDAAQLVRFFAEADRAKFAAAPDQGAAWAGWVAGFVAAAGASSTISGR
mgnify:CR=1 FL=1